jgi:hypothetical protein
MHADSHTLVCQRQGQSLQRIGLSIDQGHVTLALDQGTCQSGTNA